MDLWEDGLICANSLEPQAPRAEQTLVATMASHLARSERPSSISEDPWPEDSVAPSLNYSNPRESSLSHPAIYVASGSSIEGLRYVCTKCQM